MPQTILHERPDYVLSFETPPGTEVKHIKGHWYLYQTLSAVGPDGRRRKKSGPLLGSITPEGFVESRKRRRERVGAARDAADGLPDAPASAGGAASSPTPPTADAGDGPAPERPAPTTPHGLSSDSLEVGATAYFYQRTRSLRARLKKHFPDTWQALYVVALIRVIHGPHFRRVKLHYQCSMLGELFPCIDLGPAALRRLLEETGKDRASIREFMLEDVSTEDTYLLVDGHRMITASRGRDLAERGYDSKQRHKEQVNLLYMFTLDESRGSPAYYKQYCGSTPDVTAFEDILNDCGLSARNVLAVTDKGFASASDFDLLVQSGLAYIVPLKRGNAFVKGKIPASPAEYASAFTFERRTILFTEVEAPEGSDFRVFLYCDTSLYKNELFTLVSGHEKKAATHEVRVRRERAARKKGKGKISDERLAEMRPPELSKVIKDKESLGTVTLRVRADGINGQQAFCIWKTRQSIEQFFKTYDDTLFFDEAFTRDDVSEEGRLFLNHLSSMIAMSTLDEIERMGLSRTMSLNDLRETLRTIHADLVDGMWMVRPIKSEVSKLTDRLGIDVADLSPFDGIVSWRRNPDVPQPPVPLAAELD